MNAAGGASAEPTEALTSFASYLCLVYHEARNVRHLVRVGVREAGPYQRLLSLPRNRKAAWAVMQDVRAGASQSRSAAAACRLFARQFGVSLDGLVELYEDDHWRHAKYGGNRWSDIARSVIEFRDALDRGDPCAELFETILRMWHNTGLVGDKLRALDASLGR